ncbi:protein kinase [bacterium]|nr:protein kinase [bacterium]
MTEARTSFEPGQVIGERYRIDRVLGQGGMGAVYQATDLKLNIPIALKMLLPSMADTVNMERLRQEILLSRKVTHENVCRVYDLEEIDGQEYITMELVTGTNLRENLDANEPFMIGRTLHIVKQILRGLDAAHRMGVIHCDLKLENIMLGENDHVFLMDFGISRAADQPDQASGPIMGTPEYLAPEQIRNGPIDARTDLYSLGVIMFEMLTGVPPFHDFDLYITLAKTLKDKVTPPSELRPEIPKGLEQIILMALEKAPNDRFQSADEFLSAIQGYEGTLVDEILHELTSTRRRVVKLMAVLETHRSLSSTTSMENLLDVMLETAVREVNADRATLFIIDPKRQVLWSKISAGEKNMQIEIPLGKGIAGQVAQTGEVINIADAYSDPRFNQDIDKKTGYRTRNMLTVPLHSYRGEIAGVLQLLNKSTGNFSDEDIDFLKQVGSHAVTLLENAQIQEHAFVQMRMEKEIKDAYEVQKKLLLDKPVEFPGLTVVMKHFGENIIGGNYFDFIPFTKTRFWMVLADTPVPGLPAALLASNFQGSFQLLAEESDTFQPVVQRMNKHLNKFTQGLFSISAVFFDYLKPVHNLIYINAGTPNPLLFKQGKFVQMLTGQGIPLGLEPTFEYKAEAIEFQKGAILVVFTPGIITATNPEGEEYGLDRLQHLLEQHATQKPQDLLEIFERDWNSFRGDREFLKDSTLIIVKCND